MAKRVQFPIRVKLLLLISILLLAATGTYLSLALQVFREDKTTLVYELNANTVKTLAAETEAALGKVADKIKLLTQGHQDEAWTRAVLAAEPDLVSFTLFAPPEGVNGGAFDNWKPVFQVRNSEYLRLYGINLTDAEPASAKPASIPFAKVLAKRSWVLNSTVPGGAPLLTLALAIDVNDGDTTVERVAVVDVRLDKTLKLLSGRGIASVYLVNDDGELIAHSDNKLIASHSLMADVPLVREAIDSKLASQTRAFQWNGVSWLGAYSSIGLGGLHVISQTPETEAFRAVRKLLEKSVLFALIVITVGLLLSGWVAYTLTDPIERLLDATEKLSRWEFGGSIHVATRDEIARLASSFNSMASHLQSQRAELESSRQELEIKVRERTEALEGQKRHLSEAQDALVRTTRLASLGELAGSAAHEVLNPVNNMNIRIERLRGGDRVAELQDVQLLGEILSAWKKSYENGGWAALEADLRSPVAGGTRPLFEEDLENLLAIAADFGKRSVENQEDLEFFSREITRVTRIINTMRSLSRVGGERKPLDIHSPIDDTALSLADLLQKRGVTLVRDFSADPRDRFSIVGDKDELVQVFSNLLRNALHALASAKRRVPTVRIATHRGSDRVEVRISDNGTGIKPEHLGQIFEPDFTTKSVEEGTGLGLAISRRLVRAFGGDLEVERSIEGEGTTFLVWFPSIS